MCRHAAERASRTRALRGIRISVSPMSRSGTGTTHAFGHASSIAHLSTRSRSRVARNGSPSTRAIRRLGREAHTLHVPSRLLQVSLRANRIVKAPATRIVERPSRSASELPPAAELVARQGRLVVLGRLSSRRRGHDRCYRSTRWAHLLSRTVVVIGFRLSAATDFVLTSHMPVVATSAKVPKQVGHVLRTHGAFDALGREERATRITCLWAIGPFDARRSPARF